MPPTLFYLPFILTEIPRFLIQKSLFSNPMLGWMLRKAGQIEVNRQDGRAAFNQACEALRNGETVVIYPEGRLNPDHQNFRGKSGAVRMSLKTGAPIIPLGIYVPPSNLKDWRLVWAGRFNQGRWQISGQCFLKSGEPWRPEGNSEQKRVPAHLLTDELMKNIYGLVADIKRKETECESRISHSLIRQW